MDQGYSNLLQNMLKHIVTYLIFEMRIYYYAVNAQLILVHKFCYVAAHGLIF